MEAYVEIHNPESTKVSMTFTMELGRWKQLLAQIKHLEQCCDGWEYPASKMREYIDDLVRKITKNVTSDVKP